MAGTATLLIAGLPAGTELTLDLSTWAVGAAFMGVAGVPAGCHVLASAPSPGELRSARLLHARAGQVLVATWDAREERLRVGPREVDADDAARLAAGLARRELDARLAPYQHELNSAWAAASSRISPGVIERIEPVAGALPTLQLADAPPVPAAARGQQPAAGEAAVAAAAPVAAISVAIAAPTAAAPPRATLDTWHQHAMGLAGCCPSSSSGSSGGGDDDGALAAPQEGATAAASSTTPLAHDPRVRALRAQAAACDGADASAQGRLFYTALPGVGGGSAPAARTARAIDSSACLEGAAGALQRRLFARAAAASGGGGGGALGPPAAATAAEQQQQLLQQRGDVAAHLLGELQAAFVLALLGHSQPSLRQWTLLADAVLRAEDGALQLCAAACGGHGPRGAAPWLATLACPHTALLPAALDVIAAQLAVAPPELVCGSSGDGGGPAAAAAGTGGSGGAAALSDTFLRRAVGELARKCRRVRAQRAAAAAAAPRRRRAGEEAGCGVEGDEEQAATPCGRLLLSAQRIFSVCRTRFGWRDVGDAERAGAGEAPVGSEGRAFASREALLAALAAEGGDDDLPVIVDIDPS